eukprot:55530_1
MEIARKYWTHVATMEITRKYWTHILTNALENEINKQQLKEGDFLHGDVICVMGFIGHVSSEIRCAMRLTQITNIILRFYAPTIVQMMSAMIMYDKDLFMDCTEGLDPPWSAHKS